MEIVSNSDISEQYMIELIALDSTFGDFTQLCDFIPAPDHTDPNNNIDCYNHMTSLLYSAISEQHVEFHDGRPTTFVIYQLIASIGSSKDPEICSGMAKLINNKINFSECNFHSDYFYHHPLYIKVIDCYDNKCNIDKDFLHKGIWCLSCNGEFKYASQLQMFMHDKIKFTSMPRDSVIHIEKICTAIDENDLECIRNVKNFLETDKSKITILQNSILGTERKIKKIINNLKSEKERKQQILDKILSRRGGSLEHYNQMLLDFETKFINLSKKEEE